MKWTKAVIISQDSKSWPITKIYKQYVSFHVWLWPCLALKTIPIAYSLDINILTKAEYKLRILK